MLDSNWFPWLMQAARKRRRREAQSDMVQWFSLQHAAGVMAGMATHEHATQVTAFRHGPELPTPPPPPLPPPLPPLPPPLAVCR